MAVFVFPMWAKFNELTRHWQHYQKFPARTQLFTGQSLADTTQPEVVAPSPWLVLMWLVDADCTFYDRAPTTTPDKPIPLRVPLDNTEESISTLKQSMETPNGGQLIFGLVGCPATLDIVSEDFVNSFALKTRKSQAKIPIRLANGQLVAYSIVCDIHFELVRHEFQRTFYVLRDLRVADLVLCFPWVDDEHASSEFSTSRVFTLIDGTAVATQIEMRRPKCLLVSYAKIQKLVRKTRRNGGRNVEFYVIDVSPPAEQPRQNFTLGRSILQSNMIASGRYSTVTSRMSYCN
jgi:hypothetical protein